MSSVLEKQLARALDVRLAVFMHKAKDKSLLHDEMSLRAAALVASEIIMPCCCLLCNKAKLENLLAQTKLCANNAELTQRLAALVYDDLARCNGLG